MSMNPHIRRNS